jgi:hypothetical protein
VPIHSSDLEEYAPVPPQGRRECAGVTKAAESKIRALEGISCQRRAGAERESARERRLEETEGGIQCTGE